MTNGNALIVGADSGQSLAIYAADDNFRLIGGDPFVLNTNIGSAGYCPCVSADGKTLFVAATDDSSYAFTTDDFQEAQKIPVTSIGINFLIDRYGNLVCNTILAKITKTVAVTGEQFDFVNFDESEVPFRALAMQWSPAKDQLYVLVEGPEANLWERAVFRYDAETGALIDHVFGWQDVLSQQQLNWSTDYFCFGPDGYIYAATSDQYIFSRFDAQTGQFIDTWPAQVPARIRTFIFTRDGKYLYASFDSGLAEIEVATRQLTRTFPFLQAAKPVYMDWVSSPWVATQIRNQINSDQASTPARNLSKGTTIPAESPRYPAWLTAWLMRIISGDPALLSGHMAPASIQNKQKQWDLLTPDVKLSIAMAALGTLGSNWGSREHTQSVRAAIKAELSDSQFRELEAIISEGSR